MARTNLILIITLLSAITSCQSAKDGVGILKNGFQSPPPSARPGVYWYFMDGNLDKEGMTKDLEAMDAAGIGYVLFLEVNVGVPRGDVDYLSDEWMDAFCHGVKECERLGIQMILGIGPGWTGSGGPWVQGSRSMRHLVSSSVQVKGGRKISIDLEIPEPNPPYFGTDSFTPEMMAEWDEYYEDVTVLAFPTLSGESVISDILEKALYVRAPYSSAPGTKQYLPTHTDGTEKCSTAVDLNSIIDISSFMAPNGHLEWDAPQGEWTIMRFGSRNNGAVTRPAPIPGVGMECDKFDREALMAHFEHYTEKLFSALGERPKSFGGIKYLHMDSWEMGAQNWTSGFREEFIRRRGYDPLPYYPVYSGITVGSREISERFLYDLRLTCQELVIENHTCAVRDYAHEHGLLTSIEPYDMNPTADLELACSADTPMAEFWSEGFGYNTSFAAAEGASAAHLIGSPVVPAESFTSHNDGWALYPGRIKNQTDWAFGAGINRLIFHTFAHQCLADDIRPGMTMGPYGVHWDRNQTWWPMSIGYHTYVGRCQFLLQQGRTVADILYLTPESIPHVFKAPDSAYDNAGTFMPDRKGYNFDACPPGMIYKAEVENGKIVFPSGASYSVLVLPEWDTASPELLEKILSLAKSGATIVGRAPVRAPGLSGYPSCDDKVKELVSQIWGSGQVIIPRGESDHLYQPYRETSSLLNSMGIKPDFISSFSSIRYTHRTTPDADIYFVSNREDQSVDTEMSFRISGMKAEIWDPVTGRTAAVTECSDDGTVTSFSLGFKPYQSFFAVFSEDGTGAEPIQNDTDEELFEISGPWTVSFDPEWGRKEPIVMDSLYDWTSSVDPLVKYYSGTAVYKTSFNFSGEITDGFSLDLGKVSVMANIRLNGQDLGITWVHPFRADISEALHKGDNELEIRVVNLWINRLVGDRLNQPCITRTSYVWDHYDGKEPLLESGLTGPVKLLRHR